MELKSKSIAVLCDYALLPERVGGMDYFFWEFDTKCKENGIEVDWFFPNTASHGNYTSMKIFDCNQDIEGHFLQTDFEQNEYDFVITHFLELCTPFFYKIKKKADFKVIAVDHNPRPLNGYSFKKKLLKRIKGVLFSKYITLFVGVSDYTKNEIIKDFGSHVANKTKVIYNGVLIDEILERESRNSVHPKFLVASHLRESKGIQDLIDAVAMLPKNIKDEIKIDIYGDGPFKKNLIQKISGYDLKTFNFKGNNPSLNAVYYRYDYLLQPTHMECFSLSILESLAANVPVITTDVGGNEEAVKNGINGYIYTVKDIKSLSEILKKIWQGDEKIQMNTRKEIETKFSLNKMVEEHFNLVLTR